MIMPNYEFDFFSEVAMQNAMTLHILVTKIKVSNYAYASKLASMFFTSLDLT